MELKIKQVLELVGLKRSNLIIKKVSELFRDTVAQSQIFKAVGNTASLPEEGDYRTIVNTDGNLVIQYYTLGAWDTVNETILATPS